jgi:tripartite-type tricarboxylate transporter receptor subunit TctC
VLSLLFSKYLMGRPYFLADGVPADRVKILRNAFDAALKDPGFIAESAKLQLEIDPLTGSQIADLLKTAYSAPKPIVARAAQLAK